MSNSNDPKKGFSRFASTSNTANTDKNAQEGMFSSRASSNSQSGLSSFGSKQEVPMSRFAARMQQANAEPESAASIFSRKMEALEAQKHAALEAQKNAELARQANANYVNPAQTLLDKITKPSTTGITNQTRSTSTQSGNTQLSFKERMEALNKRQEEIRLTAASTKQNTTRPFGQTTSGSLLGQSARQTTGQIAGQGTGQNFGQAIGTRPTFAGATPQTTQTSRPSFGTQSSTFSRQAPASTTSSINAFSSQSRQTVQPATGSLLRTQSGLTSKTDTTQNTSFTERKPLFTATRTGNDSPLTTRSNPIVPTQTKGDFKISTEEFIELRDFLYEQAGIFVAENRKYLMENRLSSRLRELGLRNFHEYHKYLKFDNNRKEELNKLFENMTTNETSFFRNNPQLDVFRDKVLARVINEQRAKGQKKIHIWSAGCSSGEEPYTISMIIHELLKNEVDSWDIKITANDLSLAMLATAKKAVYSEYALRTTPQEMIDKYFTKEGKMFKVLPKVQKLVNFSQINLASSEQLAKVERSQIVFCRNVIIYFDDEMKRHVISSFYDNLLPGGFLLIGHSESLHSISRAFVPEHFTGAIVYGKKN